MKMTHLPSDEGDYALAELVRLISGHLLADGSIANHGTHLVFHGGSEDFREAVLAAVTETIGETPRDKLLAIVMGKVRQDLRQQGQKVLPDDELPPGFSSN